MEATEIEIGATYSNGKTRKRTVVGFSGYMVLFKTPSSPRTTTGVPSWDFAKWAKEKV